jgi:hypothetical protein
MTDAGRDVTDVFRHRHRTENSGMMGHPARGAGWAEGAPKGGAGLHKQDPWGDDQTLFTGVVQMPMVVDKTLRRHPAAGP